MMSVWFIVLFSCVFLVNGQFEEDGCVLERTGEYGRCIFIDNCRPARRLLRRGGRPQTCGFRRNRPIVCCPINGPPQQQESTSSQPVISTQAPGVKSAEKCKEYNNVKKQFNIFVVGGRVSKAKEFPHMALIGYGDSNDIHWLCGGSLVSDEYVLTAGHCLRSAEYGPPAYARLGDLDIAVETDDAKIQEFQIVDRIAHPQYSPPSQYNDIALLRLNRKATFTDYVRPACLYTEFDVGDKQLVATGWGKTDFAGELSTKLMDVNLNYVPNDRCRPQYTSVSTRKLSNGIDETTQICAGGTVGKDTCQGDSGGPLQTSVSGVSKPYAIIGVTSFGKACGLSEAPGVYTRVSSYVPWLESILWP